MTAIFIRDNHQGFAFVFEAPDLAHESKVAREEGHSVSPAPAWVSPEDIGEWVRT